jgi:hypothetical protein
MQAIHIVLYYIEIRSGFKNGDRYILCITEIMAAVKTFTTTQISMFKDGSYCELSH